LREGDFTSRELKTRYQITLSIDKGVAEYLKSECGRTGMPISRYIDSLVKRAMKENEERERFYNAPKVEENNGYSM
jgi:hypothetical protein